VSRESRGRLCLESHPFNCVFESHVVRLRLESHPFDRLLRVTSSDCFSGVTSSDYVSKVDCLLRVTPSDCLLGIASSESHFVRLFLGNRFVRESLRLIVSWESLRPRVTSSDCLSSHFVRESLRPRVTSSDCFLGIASSESHFVGLSLENRFVQESLRPIVS
jgi:hypothetical protein